MCGASELVGLQSISYCITRIFRVEGNFLREIFLSRIVLYTRKSNINSGINPRCKK